MVYTVWPVCMYIHSTHTHGLTPLTAAARREGSGWLDPRSALVGITGEEIKMQRWREGREEPERG